MHEVLPVIRSCFHSASVNLLIKRLFSVGEMDSGGCIVLQLQLHYRIHHRELKSISKMFKRKVIVIFYNLCC